ALGPAMDSVAPFSKGPVKEGHGDDCVTDRSACAYCTPTTDEITVKSVEGSRLSSVQARELEDKIGHAEGDSLSRAMLIGYYATARDVSERAAAQRQHADWFITNCPELELPHLVLARRPALDPEGYEQISRHLLEQVKAHPENAAIRANASSF